MTPQDLIDQLSKNYLVFRSLFKETADAQALWKPDVNNWSMLEVVCHLVDEEKFDFKSRVSSILDNPAKELTKFNPLNWVTEHKYMAQDFNLKTEEFLEERSKSIKWLSSLKEPKWQNGHIHPKMGTLTAEFFLANWLAHDYIHIRQLNRLSYEYLQYKSSLDLEYAGNW